MALDDSATVAEGGSVTVQVLGNDSDPDLDTLSITSVSIPVNGSALVNGDSIVYTHDGSETISDIFTYTISDGSLTDTATVTITVTPVNDPPVALDDAYSTNEDTLLSVVPAAGLLANDTDTEEDALTVVLVAPPTNGNLTLNSDGSFTYMPNADFFGSDSFTYRSQDTIDTSSQSDPATVTITVYMLIHIESIQVTIKKKGALYEATAEVIILNDQGLPVGVAAVSGQWTLPDGSTRDVSGTTNRNGVASFSTGRVQGSSGESFTFTATDVSKDGATYDPAPPTSGSATIP